LTFYIFNVLYLTVVCAKKGTSPVHKVAPALLIPIALVLFGCGVSVSQTSRSTAQEAVDQATYAQSKDTKLCFAVVSSSKILKLNDNSMSITWVPCTPEVLAKIRK
jgi:uncharacterized spore protein YtfJ